MSDIAGRIGGPKMTPKNWTLEGKNQTLGWLGVEVGSIMTQRIGHPLYFLTLKPESPLKLK